MSTLRRRAIRLTLRVERLESRHLLAVSPVLLNSWFVAGQGEFAESIVGQPGGSTLGPTTTWNGQTAAVLGDVQKVSAAPGSNFVYINTPDLASYVMGPWWNNAADTQPFMNLPKDQNAIFKIAANTTYPAANHGVAGGGPVAVCVNGVIIYNAGDAFSYAHATATEGNAGDGLFNRLAEAVEAVTFDYGNGHQPGNGQYHYHTNPVALRAQLGDNIDYVGTTNIFPYDPAIYFLTHGEGADGDFREHTTNLHHSPIIGWMFDGYPIYGPYGYSSPLDSTSGVTRMRSGYSLRSITDRTTLPGWAAQLSGGKLGPSAATTAADGTYTMTPTQQGLYAGPAVGITYPLGRYGEDYAYSAATGDLDQFNGRYCKTPDFPNGTYAYFITIDGAGEPAFPYIVKRQIYGTNNGSGKVTSITEAVTTVFDVSTNKAPVVTGPTSLSVAQRGTLAFTGTSAISVSDVDAAATERVSLSVTSGTLSVNLSTGLAAAATITSGGNSSGSFVLSGGISVLNAALATLVYTAPEAGASATLSVQANDGSATNNLSGILSTAITLVDTSISVAAGQTVTDATTHTGSFALVKRGAGTLVIDRANTYSGGTVVEAGTLVIRDPAGLGAGQLEVRAGATVTIDTLAGPVSASGLALDAAGPGAGGRGGLRRGAGGFSWQPLRQLITSGRSGGSWTGTGIRSSAAAALDLRAVGSAVLNGGDALVAFAAPGDVNLDGHVDVLDAASELAATLYNSGLQAEWGQGDSNDDGVFDVLDLADAVAANLFNVGPYAAVSSAAAEAQAAGIGGGSVATSTADSLDAASLA
ncbi:MAG: YHYH protein, partial [Pirellulales bacterium]